MARGLLGRASEASESANARLCQTPGVAGLKEWVSEVTVAATGAVRQTAAMHVVTDRCEWLTEDHGVRGDRVGREVGALALRREDGELH